MQLLCYLVLDAKEQMKQIKELAKNQVKNSFAACRTKLFDLKSLVRRDNKLAFF